MASTSFGKRHHVVIIGSGFGGLFAARQLKDKNVDVTLIDKTSHHLFQPLLYQVATGILSEGEIAPNTRVILKDQENCRVIMGEVTDIDVQRHTITSESFDGTTVTPFDSLIVAAGASQAYFGHDEYAEFAPGMKTIDDALNIRAKLLGSLERAELTHDAEERRRLLTFVIIGGGPTGVELAGQISELTHHTLKGAFRQVNPSDARVVLLDAADQILAPFGKNLGGKALEALEEIDVEVHLGAKVTDVDAHSVTMEKKDGTRHVFQTDCKIWSAGVAASPLVAMIAEQTGAKLDRMGRIIVNDDLTVPGHHEIFCVGDCANHTDLPCLAQVAIQGGEYAANAIAHTLETGMTHTERLPFKYHDRGSMAIIRQFSAVSKIGHLEVSGFAGWILWLVIHLAYLVGFRSRMIAMIAWGVNVISNSRGQLTTTVHQYYARSAMGMFQQKRQEREEALAEEISQHQEELKRLAESTGRAINRTHPASNTKEENR